MFFRVFILLHTKVYLLLSIMHKCDQTRFARVFTLKMDGGCTVAYLQALQTHRTFLYLLPRIMPTEVKGMRNLFYGSDSTYTHYLYIKAQRVALLYSALYGWRAFYSLLRHCIREWEETVCRHFYVFIINILQEKNNFQVGDKSF